MKILCKKNQVQTEDLHTSPDSPSLPSCTTYYQCYLSGGGLLYECTVPGCNKGCAGGGGTGSVCK